MTQIQQAECPGWARYVPPIDQRPINYSNTPPGDGRGHRIKDLAVGDEAWIISYAVFRDDRDNLWVNGLNTNGHPDGETGTVHIVRTEDGVRVLSTPDHRWRIKEERPNRYDQDDIWVVEFPTPLEHDHICRCGTRYDCPEDPCTDRSSPFDGACPAHRDEWDRIIDKAMADNRGLLNKLADL